MRATSDLRIRLSITNLRKEDEALSDGGAEDAQQGTQSVHSCTLRLQQVQQRDDYSTWYEHIVHCKANLLRVIQAWDVDFASFPRKVGAKKQEKPFVAIQQPCPHGRVVRSTVGLVRIHSNVGQWVNLKLVFRLKKGYM